MIGLCDCNNFFVSCERVFNPALNGTPVVVLSNNDGCIISRSEEAKKLGIKMGQPFYQIKELVENNKVVAFSSNYQLYGDLSQRVMSTLKSFSPSVEIYSIDEAFINFQGFDENSLKDYGKTMVKTIKKNVGIPVSLGIAPTKTLAKVASKLCKKYPKLEGCCLMYRQENIEKVLKTFPVEDVWGIGRRYSKMLNANNVYTAEQFKQLPSSWVKSKMSVVGLRTWKVAAEKLRKQHSCAGEMQVFIYTNRHRKDKAQHYEGKLVTFVTPTNSTIEMMQYAANALKEIYKKEYGYKKAGVILYNIMPEIGIQKTLFDNLDRSKHSHLMQTMNKINAHHGKNAVSVSAQGTGKIPAHQERISPRYTTCQEEILVVNV